MNMRRVFRIETGDEGAWPALILGLGLVATLAAYWSGLHGGFLFDDFPNIVHNPSVHVATSSLANWWAAAKGSPTNLMRPLAMVSFAVNYYFGGLDPFWFKLVNVALHLVCGVLTFGLLRALLLVWRQYDDHAPAFLDTSGASVVAALVACAWLLAPINLAAVLYVVQRMTIIAQMFVLAGLWAYVTGRTRQLGDGRGWPWIGLGLFVLPYCGLGGKETAVLTPAYALALELTLFGFATARTVTYGSSQKSRQLLCRPDKRLLIFFALLITLPFLYFIATRLPGLMNGSTFAARDFTVGQRLLTESRIVVHYIYWTLLPWLGHLSFYHNLGISKGLFRPWPTALCIAGLGALAVFALGIRRRLPLVALGVLWFFAGQLLTATIIPLQLIFEHRMYFSSLGLLLVLVAILLRVSRFRVFRLPAFVLIGAFIVWSGGQTALRSFEWSNPLRQALAEAQSHPNVPAAQYALGRQLLIVGRGHPKLLKRGRQALIRAQNLPNAGVMPSLTLITMAGRTDQPLNPEWYQKAVETLRQKPIQPASISALTKLVHCQIEGPCQQAPHAMLPIFLAALAKQPHNSNLLSAYSQFAAFELGDHKLARRMANLAVAHSRFKARQRRALSNILASGPKTPSRP